MKIVEKSEMHPMTSEWPWTLNSQTYSLYTKYLPQGQILVHFALRPDIQNTENQKCPEWTQNDIERLTAKSSLSGVLVEHIQGKLFPLHVWFFFRKKILRILNLQS